MTDLRELNLKKIKDLLYRGAGCAHYIDKNEISHIEANGQNAFSYGLGHAHGKQRGLQIGLMQIILQGRLNEFLGDDDQLIETDLFMEKFSFYHQARKEVSQLLDEDKKYLQAYVDGLNEARHQHFPIEFKILKIPFIKWTLADSLSLLKLMGFLGLAQTQLDAEKFVAQSLAKGIDYKVLHSLFYPNLPEHSPTDLALFPQLNFDHLVIPENYFFQSLPALKNSNNWVTQAKKNSADTAMMAFDPHLEVNRLPALWFECVWYSAEQYSMGITLPGLPGIIMGRNNQLAFSFTYGFMDTFDYFIETIKDGLVLQEQNDAGLNVRAINKTKKNGQDLNYFLFSTERGPLEVPEDKINKQGAIKDGLYLSRSWSAENTGCAQAIGVLRNMHLCQNTDEACLLAKNLFISANWLFCDNQDNIAYQQSGYQPQRSNHSDGIVALDASKDRNHWRDYKNLNNLIHIKNPQEGFLCTANNQIPGSLENNSIKLPMASYRTDRIAELLKQDNNHNYQKAKAIQSDLFSRQAQQYIAHLYADIPDTPNGRLLKNWDFIYEENSKAATLFENFLSLCYEELLGPIIGQKAWLELSTNSHFLADYYGLLDRILLSPQDSDIHCFYNSNGENAREKAQEFLKQCLLKTLSSYPAATIEPWKKQQQFVFSHILLGEKLPKWLPVNAGPYSLPGSRATICQGNLYKHKGRISTFAPSYRFISAIVDNFAFTILPGGPSDRFWKKSFRSEISLWKDFQYKTLSSFVDSDLN